MKKLHLDRNNNIKFLIYFFSIFIFTSLFLSFLYKGKISDLYSNIYTKVFLNQDKYSVLNQENETLKNEIQNFKNIILEKNISEDQVSVGIIDKIKADKINISILNKNIIYSEILLNKGISSGVEVGYRVYASGFKIIGVITEVNENSSKLKLYSDNNFESEFILKEVLSKIEKKIDDNISTTTQISSTNTQVQVENSETYKGYTFFGIGDGAYGIKIKIPSNLSVKILDPVYTKDDTVNPVGEVISVQDIISQKEKEVYVKTYYNSSINTSFYITK